MALSGVSTLATYVAAWPPPGPLHSSFQFHHQGSNFAIFVIFFALCMMEVVVLKIITEEQRDQGSRSVTSMWFDMDED
ncbi:PREDICTED: uncharacterized protein LOC106124320 [Papilio xuthus]|uniref:Uncharacterized protein LOC106124320 n=1 Tax=Papilio xuthus TaxID=66420 RepID=I4DJN3_PAPXU|nr:PREDICTED: uncharacterized protein LOC106124320 [Papilio xuthus]BAM18123.1 unknown secreted protein [Papilio xuthus]